MTLPDAQRARYLEALGIDLWVRRGQAAATTEFAASTPVPVPEAAAPARRAPPAEHRPERGRSRPAAPPAAAAATSVLPAPAVAGVAAAPPASVEPVAADWEGLRQQVLACTRCALHQGRTQAVFASGDRQARWMVIGEAPGADEDRQGEPFVGRAGQLLNAMLVAIGLPRPTVFVANMLKCRPPQNRDPRPDELAACRPFLARQLELLQPTLILVVGRIAAQNLLGTDSPLGRLRGQVHRLDGLNLPAVVTYHPAYLLRSPADKRKAWEDLKFARRVFGELASVSVAARPAAGGPVAGH